MVGLKLSFQCQPRVQTRRDCGPAAFGVMGVQVQGHRVAGLSCVSCCMQNHLKNHSAKLRCLSRGGPLRASTATATAGPTAVNVQC